MRVLFKKLSKNKIKILLSDEDMLSFELEYEQIDYKDERTRDAIMELLELAEEETGFCPQDGHLFIEAYPQSENGCIIYFTAVSDSQSPEKEAVCVPVVFVFDDIEVIISGAKTLFKTYSHRIFKSSLFYGAGKYYLVIYPFDQSQFQSVMLLGEYGQIHSRGELSVAFLREHCKTIMQDNAIESITYYLSDNKNF